MRRLWGGSRTAPDGPRHLPPYASGTPSRRRFLPQPAPSSRNAGCAGIGERWRNAAEPLGAPGYRYWLGGRRVSDASIGVKGNDDDADTDIRTLAGAPLPRAAARGPRPARPGGPCGDHLARDKLRGRRRGGHAAGQDRRVGGRGHDRLRPGLHHRAGAGDAVSGAAGSAARIDDRRCGTHCNRGRRQRRDGLHAGLLHVRSGEPAQSDDPAWLHRRLWRRHRQHRPHDADERRRRVEHSARPNKSIRLRRRHLQRRPAHGDEQHLHRQSLRGPWVRHQQLRLHVADEHYHRGQHRYRI
jgi:hypothetical protein